MNNNTEGSFVDRPGEDKNLHKDSEKPAAASTSERSKSSKKKSKRKRTTTTTTSTSGASSLTPEQKRLKERLEELQRNAKGLSEAELFDDVMHFVMHQIPAHQQEFVMSLIVGDSSATTSTSTTTSSKSKSNSKATSSKSSKSKSKSLSSDRLST
eukprot:CAMPEP_0178998606 /NCGR_PEP_ID=MMETSP0795-20121207/9602_1 /TAXON_ID=88552 /ORGANISM="Amoebophrya sp., Strain Ameob2" /LENGTH=154 /DNA_ID=CAMNT_0020691295 /DNA_START=32 /DNA_END=496 /DNA_ORIENTATION=+